MKRARFLSVALLVLVGCRGVIGLESTTLDEDGGMDSASVTDGASDAQDGTVDSTVDTGTAHDTAPPEDTSVVDTGADHEAKEGGTEDAKDSEADTDASDSSQADASEKTDADSGSVDSATLGDSATHEAGTADSAGADSAPGDTSVADTASVDTGVLDTGTFPDAAMCSAAGMNSMQCVGCCMNDDEAGVSELEQLIAQSACFCDFVKMFADAGPNNCSPPCLASSVCPGGMGQSVPVACQPCFGGAMQYAVGNCPDVTGSCTSPECSYELRCVQRCPAPAPP